ncbi:aspartate/glutamate racemase family protein, partial [Sandarakinorhabdus oryzae]|uniref:aspartate/glutamate racemase family protein n=1 Tax=Sandarakinorhabdus oryzae TaxID=2675220 RepID=UPI0018CC61DE
ALAGEAARLAAAGAEVVIAACTEVPLLLAQADVPVPLIDSTAALARATLAAARLPDRLDA